MKTRIILISLVILFIVLLGVFVKTEIFKNRGVPITQNGKISVVASFYPLAEFARQVGHDRVNVINLTPAGVEPHDYDPSPQDVIAMQKSQVFIYNGAGFEPWVEKLLPDIQKSVTIITNTSQNIALITGTFEKEKIIFDPHIWLDPVFAIKQVDTIKESLVKADPQNQTSYETNASEYRQKLIVLDEDFQNGLAKCAIRDVIVSHEAFGYLAKRYNLKIISISGLIPNEEPSPQKMAEIVQFARKNNVKFIFFETLVSPSLSETIAREIGAETLVFNPIEGLTNSEIANGKDYFSIQRENLANLKIALNCK